MRFRCTVGREQFKLLYDHVALLERIGKNAIVHWAKDACRMIVITDDEHLLLYTTLNTVRHHLVKSVCLRITPGQARGAMQVCSIDLAAAAVESG
jgi:hypothetical protein